MISINYGLEDQCSQLFELYKSYFVNATYFWSITLKILSKLGTVKKVDISTPMHENSIMIYLQATIALINYTKRLAGAYPEDSVLFSRTVFEDCHV